MNAKSPIWLHGHANCFGLSLIAYSIQLSDQTAFSSTSKGNGYIFKGITLAWKYLSPFTLEATLKGKVLLLFCFFLGGGGWGLLFFCCFFTS